MVVCLPAIDTASKMTSSPGRAVLEHNKRALVTLPADTFRVIFFYFFIKEGCWKKCLCLESQQLCLQTTFLWWVHWFQQALTEAVLRLRLDGPKWGSVTARRSATRFITQEMPGHHLPGNEPWDALTFHREACCKKGQHFCKDVCFRVGSRLFEAALQVFNCPEDVLDSSTVVEQFRWMNVFGLWSRDVVLPVAGTNSAKIVTMFHGQWSMLPFQ